MRVASFIILLLLLWGYLHTREGIRPEKTARPPADSGGGMQRMTSDSSVPNGLERRAGQSREFIRIKLPPAAAETPERQRIVVVDGQPGGGAIDFTSRSPQARIDEIGIPGLIAPETLAIEKQTLAALSPPPFPMEPVWDIAALPRAEVRGIEPPARRRLRLSLPPLRSRAAVTHPGPPPLPDMHP